MSAPFIGQLMYVGFNFAPKGWALANGQLLSIQQNPALFSLLGTFYGGNGTTNFALPDMRGRAPVHNGQGPGLSTYTIGEVTGTQSATLTTPNLPLHIHQLQASTNDATSQIATTDAMLAKAVSGGGSMVPDIYIPAGAAGQLLPTSPANIAATGGGQPFTLIQPYLTINCTVALTGIFPSRN